MQPVEVVLLHGFGLGVGSWGPVVAALDRAANQLEVIAVELCPPGRYRPPPSVVDLLVGERSERSRVLVGHSLGSHVALELMAAHPDWADAVLLLSVGSDEAAPEYFRSRAHRYADLIRRDGVDGFADRFLAEVRFMDSSGVLRQSDLLSAAIRSGDPLALAACADDYLAYEALTGSLIGQIALSADWSRWTVLAGGGDIPAVEWIPSARRLMPGARIEVVDDVAHLLPTDCPDLVAEEILRLTALVQLNERPR